MVDIFVMVRSSLLIIIMIDYEAVKSNFLAFTKQIADQKHMSSAWLEAAWNNYDVEEMGLEVLTLD